MALLNKWHRIRIEEEDIGDVGGLRVSARARGEHSDCLAAGHC